ncbi:MAG TPA: conjugal transfer protein TraF [Bacteroidota bacterium]|nr:conjugal transfer protein TraF [Bacteroidota bacterium]
MKRLIAGLATFLVFSSSLYSQYYIGQQIQLPDTTIFTESLSLPISPNREDVKAIGMGKTQIANGRTFNAMMYNPALLARDRFRFDLAGIQASLPNTTLKAIDFLRANKTHFSTGLFLQQISQGINEFGNATTLQQQEAAVQKINSGLRFLNSLQAEVIGTEENPKTHGIGIVPNIQAQFGTWGFSLFASAQSGFQVQPGRTVSDILALKLPDDPSQFTVDAITRLAEIIFPLFEPNTNQLDVNQALPEIYALSYVDIVGAGGYAMDVGDGLFIGANVKVINRRFSTKRIASDNIENIVSEARSDFQSSQTGFTVDLGGFYTMSSGTQLGVSLQNILPIQKITSHASINTEVGAIVDYQRDAGGNPIVNGNGDTALVAVQRLINIRVPFDLKTPFVANIGLLHPLTDQWDIAFDWSDIFAQDIRFESTAERFRIGTEYRLDALTEVLGLALRGGLADGQITIGLGLNLFRVIQIDGAIAKDQFVGERAYFGQIKIGW